MALPKLDGQQVVGRLKAHPRAARIPVIALSAQAMAGDRERFLDAGCDDYIAKPLDPGELLEKLERWLAGREQTTS
jgi:CheY-like chemotaxis protein